MKAKLALGTAFALILAGCASTTPATTTKAAAAQASSKTFLCQNGIAPTLNYINDSQAQITIDNQTSTLTLAPAASGSRYVSETGIFNHGGEWHQKGDLAVFSYKNYHGIPAQTNCQAQ